MKPLLWMRLVRDADPKRPAKRLAVLWALALRMGPDGTGYAAASQLANDAGVHRATVTRTTGAERKAGYLVQTRRGHRITDGKSLASGWRLTDPDAESQRCTSASLAADPTSQTADPTSHDVRHSEVYLPEVSPTPVTYSTTEGQSAASRNGGREEHPNEPNARRALAALRADRALPVTDDVLVDLAYAVAADPWQGYLSVKAATEQTLAGARDPDAVLRKRLGVAS